MIKANAVHHKDQGFYSPTILKNIFCLFLHDFVILKLTILDVLIGLCYFQMLLNIEKSGEQAPERFFRIIGE